MPDLTVWGRSELSKLERDLDRLINEMCFDFGLSSGGITGAGGVSIREEGDNLLISLGVQGFAVQDIDLTVEDDRVAVQAVKHANHGMASERRSMRRQFALPVPVDSEKAEAALDEGVLTITVPKRRAGRPSKVRIHGK
jgi:HSP20 family protein